jgi:chaperonin GroEL (HSP60 family)
VGISKPEQYDTLHGIEQTYHKEMIEQLLKCGVNTVLCQWGFDHESNYLLYSNNITAVRWIAGDDLERIAMAVGAKVI